MCEFLIGLAGTKANVIMVLICVALAAGFVAFVVTRDWRAALIAVCLFLLLPLAFQLGC